MDFNFDNLNSTKFEEFCYDLLLNLEPIEIKWRKGTGLDSSPSDQGRDIEAIYMRKDIDGSAFSEKWFIECKHYKKGVPPEKLSNALAWASSERPDVLLIVASGFLSNACHQYLLKFKERNKPPFRIIVWEQKNLESQTSGNVKIRKKYNLPTDLPFLNNINNYHAEYSLKSHYNSIEYFLSLMDDLDSALRDEIFTMAFYDLIKPREREPQNEHESIRDCMIDKFDYESYKYKLLSTAKNVLPVMYVSQTVTEAIGMYFSLADVTNISKAEENISELLKIAETKGSERAISVLSEQRKNVAESTKRRYTSYNKFCDTFIKKLLAETPSIK